MTWTEEEFGGGERSDKSPDKRPAVYFRQALSGRAVRAFIGQPQAGKVGTQFWRQNIEYANTPRVSEAANRNQGFQPSSPICKSVQRAAHRHREVPFLRPAANIFSKPTDQRLAARPMPDSFNCKNIAIQAGEIFMNKTNIVFYGASVTQQSTNRDGIKVGYAPNAMEIISELLGPDNFNFHQIGFGSNHFDDAGFIRFNEVLPLKPNIIILDWHSTGLSRFDPAKLDFVVEKLLDLDCKIISLVLPLKTYIGKPERDHIKQSRWYQKKGLIQINLYSMIGHEVQIENCLKDEVHTTENGGRVYGAIVARAILDTLRGNSIALDAGDEIEPASNYKSAPPVSSLDLADCNLDTTQKLTIEFRASGPVQLFVDSTIGPHSPLLEIECGKNKEMISIWDKWCTYERRCLKPLTPLLAGPERSITVFVSSQPPSPDGQQGKPSEEKDAPARMLKEMKKLFITGGEITNINFQKTAPPKIKVFIFANCHGVLYKQALQQADTTGRLEIEHTISYENITKFNLLKNKFSDCDLLIIQPVQNYDDFKIENLKKILKPDCTIIRVPFIRFEGFWDPEDIRSLKRLSQAAVMFFPKIAHKKEVSHYLTGMELDELEIKKKFQSALTDLKNLESQGDIQFFDFFMENYKKFPLFRDSYHPTRAFYEFISSQIVDLVKAREQSLTPRHFAMPKKYNKEYGHFKPIRDKVASILALEYDLDSYYQYSRADYLTSIITYENEGSATISDLQVLQTILDKKLKSNASPAPTIAPIHLFMPYFKASDGRRQAEFISCLQKNVSNPSITKIYLLIDDKHLPEVSSEKIEVITISRRPTYQDWYKLTTEKCNSGVSILANTDIYFDASVVKLPGIFSTGKEFLALTRYEKIGEDLALHKNPHWSQDVWAISARSALPAPLVKSLDFPMGVPRCDNKIAYLFAIHGFKVFNPCQIIKTIHLHESQVRGYDKKFDRTIMGGVAYVHPSPDLVTPSKLEMQVWGQNLSHVTKIGLNKTFDTWDKEAEALPSRSDYYPQVECILIPLIKRELPDLKSYFETALRPTKSNKKTALVISIDTIWDPKDIEEIKTSFLASALADSIGRLEFVSCELTEEESIYIRDIPSNLKSLKIPLHGLKSGPNKQFFVSIDKIKSIGIKASAILLQEVDTIALRDHWIDEINHSIKKFKDALVLGATCSSVTPLGADLANHVNGNAVLCVSNPEFEQFFRTWERLVIEVVKKAPWKAYDSATEWVLHYRNQDLRHPIDGKQLKDTEFFNSKELESYIALYQRHVHREKFLLNLADFDRTQPGYTFHPEKFSASLKDVVVLHLRAALPYRNELRMLAASDTPGMIIYDADWQYPAITEKHAAYQARKFFSSSENVAYFGFPWATLIDQLLHKPEDSPRLISALNNYKSFLSGFTTVVTVCQHIHMLKYQKLFHDAGITDIFWTHAIKGQDTLPEYTHVKIKPFPLFPVQYQPGCELNRGDKHLYSFVGARSPAYYLTDSRNKIIDLLSGDPRGFVVGRNGWHYNKVVYGAQIRKNVSNDGVLVDVSTTDEFKTILRNSTFSLCPSGSGPNSIRLWESIGYGSIPVVLADTYLPPGDPQLWAEAAVFCNENEESIRALPERLEKIAKDPELLARKRHAMRQLWAMYGPDCFVHDIQQFYLSLAGKPIHWEDAALDVMVAAVLASQGGQTESTRLLLLSCSSRILSAPADFAKHYRANERLRKACQLGIRHAPEAVVQQIKNASMLKKIDLSA